MIHTSVSTLPLASLAELLAAKMWPLRKTHATVIASTPASVFLAKELAGHLGVAWDTQYCKAVEHPADSHLTIGSITSDNVLIHDNAARLPQNFIEHQVHLMKRAVAGPASRESDITEGKTFVIVREEIMTSDDVLALVQSLRKHRPAQILIATPVIERDARLELESHADGIMYLSHDSGRSRRGRARMHKRETINEHLSARY